MKDLFLVLLVIGAILFSCWLVFAIFSWIAGPVVGGIALALYVFRRDQHK